MRLGSIEFINSLPVDMALLNGAVPFAGSIVQATPAELNRQILNRSLDLSPVSVFWYAQHQDQFVLLPDLSISSESTVKSVLLFSKFKFSELSGKKIRVTAKGKTTPALLQILCRLRYGFEANIQISDDPLDKGEWDAVLVIGDEALNVKEKTNFKNPINIYDLGEEWREWTGFPLVFAVWVARKSYFQTNLNEVLAAHQAILASRAWGQANLEEILKESEKKTGLSREILASYFASLSYDFSSAQKKGMEYYLDCAARCGLLTSVAPPEFIPGAIPATV